MPVIDLEMVDAVVIEDSLLARIRRARQSAVELERLAGQGAGPARDGVGPMWELIAKYEAALTKIKEFIDEEGENHD